MFRTHPQAEIAGAIALGNGSRSWRCVEHALHAPWLYVCCAEQQGGISIRSMLLVSEIPLFESILQQQTSPSRVKSVQLVSPSYMNQGSGWLMEDLIELIEILGPNDEHQAYVYKLDNGSSYQEGYVKSEERHSQRVIFSSG
ncbi:hypothetical protein [Pseudomonas sp. W15Feb9B]|uniref:hypothetical protein n=1 Tax=Pseudomonas sp. W15Feb9B TaxID=550743 RepID=UPI000596CBCD|nr:hypothetical protein [Pseudomonas sp. W15Feb9B]KIK83079.1 hypothetical protein OC71_25135 [Pseudomonas sp. W15Feb9B]